MSERARKLLHNAMDLPVSERAELAADLLASLDGEPEADVEAAWACEIERRAREALANPDDDVAWETVRAELRAAPPIAWWRSAVSAARAVVHQGDEEP